MKTNYPMEVQVYQAVDVGELEIDNQGRIWRVKKRGWDRWLKETVTRPCKKVRAENKTGLGYLQIRTMMNSKRAQVGAHRIVWRHFNGEIPEGLTINHKNGLKDDNRPNNLELATSSQQTRHMIDVLKKGHVLNQRGEQNTMCKLTDEQVLMIRKARQLGVKLVELAKEYGVTFQTISRIALGQRRSG